MSHKNRFSFDFLSLLHWYISLNCIYSIKFKYCDKYIQIWDLEKSKHAYINP